jgi:hypothetical protein
MDKKPRLKRSPADGYDRMEWLDADGVTHALRANDAVNAERVQPGARTRRPGKHQGQTSYQGHYWCAGSRQLVFHESMTEFAGAMLIDHLHDVVSLAAQPMLLTFEDGTPHYPDYLAVEADGTRRLIDVHPEATTTEADRHKFELTARLCERLGWKYTLIEELSEVVRWNLEMMARYHHPRFAPTEKVRARIRSLAADRPTFGALCLALETECPGEHIPALMHMMWRRELAFDLHLPVTEWTLVHPAE